MAICSPCATFRSRWSEGAVFVLLGANGAGKTSILRAISGLIPARGGRVTADGHDLTGCRRIRSRAPAFRMSRKAGAYFLT